MKKIIFVPFFSAAILFGTSPIFANFKIALTIIAFVSVDLMMIFLIIFAIIKAAFSALNSDVGRGVKKAVKYLI